MTPEQACKAAAKAKRDKLSETMALHLRARGLTDGMVREHEFATSIGRLWRFDFSWAGGLTGMDASRRIALEVEGGTWTSGRHSRGKGFEEDCRKYAIAAIYGWRVIRASTDQVRSGEAGAWIQRILKGST